MAQAEQALGDLQRGPVREGDANGGRRAVLKSSAAAAAAEQPDERAATRRLFFEKGKAGVEEDTVKMIF